MDITRYLNIPAHHLPGSSNTSTLDICAPVQHDEKQDAEDGIVSRVTKFEDPARPIASREHEKPPPDGGLAAWLQVLMGHLMNINTWGYLNSYGLFEAHYLTTLSLPAATLSWPASTQTFLLCFIGVFSGRALDAGFYKPVLALGCIFQLAAVFATSFATQYWHVFLAQGIVQGIGNGLVFAPTVGLLSTFFLRRRSLAMGLMLSGSVTGGVVFPLVAQSALPRFGFAWTVRIIGFVMLFNVAVILTLARTRIAPRRSGPFLELGAFKELPYTLFAISAFLILWPVYYAYDYINIFATNITHVSSSTSLTILLTFNLAGYPGRILPALVSDYYFGPLNTLLLLSISCSILIYSWISVFTFPSLLVFTVVYGILNGGVQGLVISALSSLTTDLSKMGARMGMIFTVLALCTLTGAPIAGALIDAESGSFFAVQLFGGTSMLVGAAILVAARASQTGWVLMRRM